MVINRRCSDCFATTNLSGQIEGLPCPAHVRAYDLAGYDSPLKTTVVHRAEIRKVRSELMDKRRTQPNSPPFILSEIRHK